MRIAILGTRGIPNNYGGFEQFAEFLSMGLVRLGHSVTVYNPHFHPYQQSTLDGVEIRKIHCPENIFKSAAHYIYDYLCLRDALKQDFDIIYEAGYGTAAFSYGLKKGKGKPFIVTNMDGLEWKRSKWNKLTQKVMRYAETVAVRKSDYLISDNIGIQEYFKHTYNKDSFFLAYGADEVTSYDYSKLEQYEVTANNYYLLIARLEPENSIELILDAYVRSKEWLPLLVIGNKTTSFGKYLLEKYKNVSKIHFLGGVYDKSVLDALRCASKAYLHGHTVGGTNPSLLEAMASNAFIIAHNNSFNKSVLKTNALFFNTEDELVLLFDGLDQVSQENRAYFKSENIKLISKEYTWDRIIELHQEVFYKILEDAKM